MALRGDAAIIHVAASGAETVHLLNAPFRGLRPFRRQRRYTFESEDGTISTRTVGSARWDAEVTVRYAALPLSLLEMLARGADGGTLLYVPSLSAGDPGYEMGVLWPDSRMGLQPDSARWMRAEYEITFVFRRPAGETLEGMIGAGPWAWLYIAGGPADGWEFARAGVAARRRRDGVFDTAAADVLRVEWVRRGGVLTPSTLLEGPGQRANPAAADFSTGAWSGASEWDLTEVPSVLDGRTAWRHTASAEPGDKQRTRVVGTFTGGPETLWAIVGEVSAAASQVQLWDNTAGQSVCTAVLVFATGVASITSGDGTAFAENLGGGLWAFGLTATGVAGHSRRITIRPNNGSTPGLATDVHYFALEESRVRSSPILSNDAETPRAGDTFARSRPPGLTSFTAYLAFQERGTVLSTSSARLAQWGPGFAGNLVVMSRNNADVYQVMVRDSGGVFSVAPLAIGPEVGDTVEILAQFEVEDGEVRGRLLQSINGGQVTSSAWTTPAAADFSPSVLYLGSRDGGNNAGLMGLIVSGELPGTDWTIERVRRLPQIRQILGRGR